MTEDGESISDPSFVGRLHSRLQTWLPMIRTAFAIEASLLVLNLLAWATLDVETEGRVIIALNLAVLIPVLLMTGSILYFVDPLPASGEEA